MKKYSFFILLLVGFGACNKGTPDELDEFKIINAHFGKYQKQDLNKILDFFDQAVCKSAEMANENLESCYENYLSNISENMAKGDLKLDIDKSEQAALMATIKKVTYDIIWDSGKGRSGANEEDKKFLKYKYESVWHRYLTAMSKNSAPLKRYVQTFEASNIITPSMIADLAINYKDFNILDERQRIILAIHYLTLNANSN